MVRSTRSEQYIVRLDALEREVRQLHAENDEILTKIVESLAERDQLRAEVKTWGEIWNDAELLAARVEALRNGTAQT
jgi:hypothetical protein